MNKRLTLLLVGVLAVTLTLVGVVYGQLPEDIEEVESNEDDDEMVCSGLVIHPVLEGLAQDYGIDYEVLLDQFCNGGFGIGELEHALSTAELEGVDKTYEELLDLVAGGMDWGEIWQDLDLIGNGAFDPDEEDLEDEDLDNEDDDLGLSLVCSGEMDHPMLLSLAEMYQVDYADQLNYFCQEKFGIGELKHALETSQADGVELSWIELLGERDDEDEMERSGWGKIWQSLGLIGKDRGGKEQKEPDLDTGIEDIDIKGKPEDHPGKGNGLDKKP